MRERESRIKAIGRGRQGWMLLEVTAAAAILAILLAAAAQVVAVMAGQQRAAERRALALQTVHNLLEQVENLPWTEVTAEAAGRLDVPESMRPYLPDAKIAAAVVNESDPVAAKRVAIALTWKTQSGQPAGPVRLTAWVFPDTPTE